MTEQEKKIEITDTPKAGSLERSTHLVDVRYTKRREKANAGLESWPERSARQENRKDSDWHGGSSFVARHP